MTVKKSLINVRPNLFTTPFVRQTLGARRQSYEGDSQGLKDINIASTSSFRYDAAGDGLKSTQQLPTDFSRFENHTFFNSAMVNVNVSFDRIINDYPFDGTFDEYETFFDLVTGFEKYVYDSFPKFVNFLHFSGATGPTTTNHGTYISTKDIAGALLPTLSKNKSGMPMIGPAVDQSISFEMQLFVAPIANDTQVVLQKLEDE